MGKIFNALLFFIIFFLVCCSKESKNRLNILFDNAEGLKIGSIVKLRGVKIGEVTKMTLLGDSVLVSVDLSNDKKIPINSKFSIVNSIIGVCTIIIEPSDEKKIMNHTDTASGSYSEKGILDTFLSDSANKKNVKDFIDTVVNSLKKLEEEKKVGIKPD